MPHRFETMEEALVALAVIPEPDEAWRGQEVAWILTEEQAAALKTRTGWNEAGFRVSRDAEPFARLKYWRPAYDGGSPVKDFTALYDASALTPIRPRPRPVLPPEQAGEEAGPRG